MSNSPPESQKPDAPQKAQGERADLSHFRPQTAATLPPKKRAALSGAFSSAVKGAQSSIEQAKTKKAEKKPMSASTKRTLVIIAALLVILPIGGLLATIIPVQLARSAAFSAFEAGNYAQALTEFRDYLADHESDNEAAYYAAQAAVKTGDYDYAARTMTKIAGAPEYSRNPGFLFTHALILSPAPEAVDALDKLVAAAPQHAGGRLLRGIMLAKLKDFARAREDFLEADSIIRGNPAYNSADLRAAHRRAAENTKAMMPVFSADSAIGENSPALRRLSSRINTPVPAGDIYINQYETITPPADTEDYGDGDLVGFYYAAVLLLNNQFREAGVEFSKLPAAAASSAEVKNLKAVRHALEGEYTEAAEQFKELAEQLPDISIFLINQANASINADPTAETAVVAAALYEKAGAANPTPAEIHNRAALLLMAGNDADAQTNIAALQNDAPPQSALLRVFVELAQNPQSDALNGLLDAAGNFPGAAYARAAHHAALGQYNPALRVLADYADETGQGWGDAARAYVRYLADFRLLMRAYSALRARAPEQEIETHYRRGVLEIAVGNFPEAEKTIQLLEQESGEHFYTDALRGLAENAKNNAEQALPLLTQALENAETGAARREIALDGAEFLLANAPQLLQDILTAQEYPGPKVEALLARLRAAKDPQNAAQQARAAAVRYPVYDVLYHAGMALADAGETEEAVVLLQNAAEWRPVNIPLLSKIQELQLPNNPEAAAETEQLINTIKWEIGKTAEDDTLSLPVDAPADAQIVNDLNQAIGSGASPEPAIRRFEELIKEASGKEQKAILLFQRGTFNLAVNRFAETEADMNAALPALPPELQERASGYLGRALERQKKYPQAAEVYRRIAETKPDVPLYRRLAGHAIANYDTDEAVVYLTETVNKFPANISGYFTLAEVLQNTQKLQEATAVLQKAARIAPLYVQIYTTLTRTQRSYNPKAARENSVIASNLL